MSLGVLDNSGLPQPILLDAIRFAETGHLDNTNARTAESSKGAIGPYQFLSKNLHDMGYNMPQNISLQDVQNPTTARNLAGRYVQGYSDYHNFTTPLQKLIAYNMGPQATANWIASGGKIEDLPAETQQYIARAADFIDTNATPQTGETQMANNSPTYTDEQHQGFVSDILNHLNPISTAQASTLPPTLPAPALTQPQQQSTGAGLPILNNYTPVTNARRDQSNMALPPKISLDEMLIRMGGSGLRAAQQGGLASLGAMADTYGQIQDMNRKSGLEAYAKSVNNQKAMLEAQSEITNFDATLDNFEKAAGFLKDGGLTGLFEGTVGRAFNRLTGDEDANKQLLLERLRVDDLLLRVAQTKGAISNKEMEIFAAPAPKFTDDDPVWEAWVKERIQAIRSVRNKLAAQNNLPQRGAYNPNSNFQPSQQQQSLVQQYLQPQ